VRQPKNKEKETREKKGGEGGGRNSSRG